MTSQAQTGELRSPHLLSGDCAEQMRALADNSIDAIVTDPPYALTGSSGSGGFMGAKWDSALPTVDMWREALRVAKPGAYLLAFGGTRTYHRLACAIEDAGWEIRDCIMWVYGCLSEDTEILTCKGWAKIGTIQIGDRIHAYDRTTKTFRYEEVKDTFLYDYDDIAYLIQSDSTDQLVSRNHRVIVERGGVEVFEYAENLAQEHEARVPVLEGLQSLLDNISLLDKRTGCSQQNLLAGMCGGGKTEDAKETLGRPFAEHDLPCLREEVLSPGSMETQSENKCMLTAMQRKTPCENSGGTQCTEPAEMDGRTQTKSQRNNDWREKLGMERRSDISPSQRKLCDCSLCALPKEVSADGATGRVCDGASSCGGKSDWPSTETNGGCTSHQSQSVRQSGEESYVVSGQCLSQIFRDAWRTTTTLARITPVHYKGRMWCVSVPSGAIIARRNGKIFVTGNSGFPKSMDVSKAIDKAMGAERDIVGYSSNGVGTPSAMLNHGHDDRTGHANGDGKTYAITAPATPEAAAWQGFGTALKPAVEPIVIARKPLDGTVAANVLKYGTGAINIDACRVPTEEHIMTNGVSEEVQGRQGIYGRYGEKKTGQTNGQKLGRFPANLIHDGSDEVLALFPESNCGKSGIIKHKTNNRSVYMGHPNETSITSFAHGGTGSAARFFYCAKASRSERGEGNVHPTVKPLALMRYLVRLVTRKGGIVLDPFMGSGTTGVAAIQEGMNFVGIERDPHYYEIASERIRKAKPVEQKPKDTQMELPL